MSREHDLVIVNVPLDEVERHPENANNGDSSALESSISVNGFYSPLIVQASSGYILAGNHRWEALVKTGAATAPVIYLDVTDEESRRIMLADNRVTRLGFDDPGLLVDLLEELSGTDGGLYGSGYNSDDLAALLNEIEVPLTFDTDDDEVPDEKANPWVIEPLASTDGICREFLITRPADYRTDQFKIRDLNKVRKLLGLPSLTDDQIVDSGIVNWSTY